MELSEDIQKYIYEFCRPVTRPDWRNGSKTSKLYKKCKQMETYYNTSFVLMKLSCCDLYLEEENYIRYYNYEFYSNNYEFWQENFLNHTGIDLL